MGRILQNDNSLVLFKNKETNEILQFINIHPDPNGADSKTGSVKILKDLITDFENNTFLFGDMNFTETPCPYQIITELLKDSYYQTNNKNNQIATYNGWRTDIDDFNQQIYRGDMIFTNFKVKSYHCDIELIDGEQASDHSPIIIEVEK